MAVNPLDFLKNMSSVKSNIDNIKKEMSKITVCGKAGSNIVVIEMDGEFNVKKVSINKEFFDDLDNGAFEQMVKSALNDAVSKVKEEIKLKTIGVLPFGM
nr:YbaB/EbfC family nucleoid-associated protein [Borreliella bavariensis]